MCSLVCVCENHPRALNSLPANPSAATVKSFDSPRHRGSGAFHTKACQYWMWNTIVYTCHRGEFMACNWKVDDTVRLTFSMSDSSRNYEVAFDWDRRQTAECPLWFRLGRLCALHRRSGVLPSVMRRSSGRALSPPAWSCRRQQQTVPEKKSARRTAPPTAPRRPTAWLRNLRQMSHGGSDASEKSTLSNILNSLFTNLALGVFMFSCGTNPQLFAE